MLLLFFIACGIWMKEAQVLDVKNVWVEEKDEINQLTEAKFSISKILLNTTNDLSSI